MTKDLHQELQLLIDHLLKNEDSLLKEWENRIREVRGKSNELATISQNKFRNDIPAFLNGYCESLKNKEISLAEIGKSHGSQRWEYGFNLQQNIKEWNVLHQVLIEEVNASQEELNLSLDTLKKAQHNLAVHIHEGIEYSIQEFDQLQRREAEAQFRDLEEAFEEPENTVRNHNLRDASHDLRGMVKNLQIGFSLLEDEYLTPNVSELIDQMSAAADSLEQLLNDLLDLFRLETNREEVDVSEFDAAKVLSELCESMQPMAQTEELDLKYSGEESLLVKNDQKKIQRIARNLLLNALKYTEEGYVGVKWEEISDKQWLLEISDTGPGLSATHAKSLTTEAGSSEAVEHGKASVADKNASSTEAGEHGEGIGLLIVRHLCKLLDAIIKIETKPGAGTTFKITLPLELAKK